MKKNQIPLLLVLNSGGSLRDETQPGVSLSTQQTEHFVIWAVLPFTHLDGHTAPGAVVVHEDPQHVWDKLRQVELELSAQCDHNLLNQKDDGVLHGVVWRPVLLKTEHMKLLFTRVFLPILQH